MPDAVINNRLTVDGIVFTRSATIDASGVQRKEAAVAAAKVGQLTTRTNTTTGTLTMTGGHGITTGARLDLYWDGGSRRGITVGTVATNSVPFSGGAGDDLPNNLTAITACVPTEKEFLMTGDLAQFIAAKSSKRGIVVFAASDDTEILAIVDELEGTNGGGYQWYTGNGLTNPFATEDVAKVFFSNGNSIGSNTLIGLAGPN